MEASSWGIVSYVMIGFGVLALIMMVFVAMKIIRLLMLVALIIFGGVAYYAHEKKVELESVIFDTKGFEKGANKVMEGLKDIGSEIGKSVDKSLSSTQKEKISDKVNESLNKFGKWTDEKAEQGVDILVEGKEKAKEKSEELLDKADKKIDEIKK